MEAQPNIEQLKSALFKNLHPQRNSFVFDQGLLISSDFDSGNLWKCLPKEPENSQNESIFDEKEQIGANTLYYNTYQQYLLCRGFITQKIEGVYEFDIWICPDSFPYQKETSSRTWFFFNVTQFPQDSKSLSFSIKNMSQQATLLGYGLRPVFIEMSEEEHRDFLSSDEQGFYNQKWKQIPLKIDYKRGPEGLEVNFSYVLKSTIKQSDFIYFAFTFPFTFSDIEKVSSNLEKKFLENQNYYFHREVLTQSIEGRPLELLTLTSKVGQLQEKENPIYVQNDSEKSTDPHLFPQGLNRPFQFDKPTVFLTARVHCGETPGQFMLQGMLEMLSDFQNIQTKVLLDKYVFKVIPCLNPDGVSRGYWRHDTEGQNLNRAYTDPDPLISPTIYGARKAVLQEFEKGKLQFYMDIHGHCNKRGCFIFGNTIKEKEKAIDQMLIPKLMSLNSVNFDIKECSFSDEKNNVKDGKGMGRDGSGRAGIFRETGLTHCFTLEANYCTGHRVNTLKQRYNIEEKQKIVKEDSIISDVSSQYYKNKKCPIYNIDVFKDVGRSFLISILDYNCLNPITRLISSDKDTLEGSLQKLRQELKKEMERGGIKQFKKANKNFKPQFELVMNDSENQQQAHDDFCIEKQFETQLSFKLQPREEKEQSLGGGSELQRDTGTGKIRSMSEIGTELIQESGGGDAGSHGNVSEKIEK